MFLLLFFSLMVQNPDETIIQIMKTHLKKLEISIQAFNNYGPILTSNFKYVYKSFVMNIVNPPSPCCGRNVYHL